MNMKGREALWSDITLNTVYCVSTNPRFRQRKDVKLFVFDEVVDDGRATDG